MVHGPDKTCGGEGSGQVSGLNDSLMRVKKGERWCCCQERPRLTSKNWEGG